MQVSKHLDGGTILKNFCLNIQPQWNSNEAIMM